MLIPAAPINNPAYGRHAEVVVLAATDSNGTGVLVKAGADGTLASSTTITPTGVGFTLAGDAITVDLSGVDSDVYYLRTGGTSGSIVQHLVLTYTSSAKTTLQSVERVTP